MSFPGSLPSYAGFTSSHTLLTDNHAAQSNAEQADVVALATKMGTGSSTPTSGLLLRGNGVGTSAWAQASLTSDVTGVLPQANGGTGTTLATGTGKAVYGTSPTISGAQLTSSPTLTAPIVTDFTNANHNHQNAAQGGKITSSAIISFNTSLTTISNPYKFCAFRTAASSPANGTVFPFDTILFDTNGDFDVTTNKGRYTAPVSGFYWFNACITYSISGNQNTAYGQIFYKNGSQVNYGNNQVNMYNGGYNIATPSSALLQLSAGDYVEIVTDTSGVAVGLGSSITYFQGFLVSQT